MLFSLRRYTQDTANSSYTNCWVADLTETGVADVYCAPLGAAAAGKIYCIYPGKREQSFFSVVPFWIFCGRHHVGQGRVHDAYPYFEVPADGAHTVFVVVATDLEQAKIKLATP